MDSGGERPADDAGPAWPWVDPCADPGTVSILLMGDTNIQFRDDPVSAFRCVQPTLTAADLRFLNLEGPFAGGSDDPLAPDIPHKVWRHSDPDQVAALTGAGIDAVGVANNVTYPWQALMRSLDVLARAGIPATGGGPTVDAAHAPVVLERKGVTVGFLQLAATVYPYNHAATATTPGIAGITVHTAYRPAPHLDKPGHPPDVVTLVDPASKARLLDDVRRVKQGADITVVSVHWGLPDTPAVLSYQTDIAHASIDAGADIVFGHGPHRYQRVEVYRGRPILYSLGQFVFDDRCKDRYRRFREGLLARVTATRNGVSGVSLVPTWREDDNQVRLYDPAAGKGRELLGQLRSINQGGAALTVKGAEIVVEGIGDRSDARTADPTGTPAPGRPDRSPAAGRG